MPFIGCDSSSNGGSSNGGTTCICTTLENLIGDHVLLTKIDGAMLYAFGDLESGTTCFITIYFRVSNVNLTSGCVVFELLRPLGQRSITLPNSVCCVPLNQVCKGQNLSVNVTNQFVTVDCDCLCSVQEIFPVVVESV
ncbi:CotY/CotZ family spore coat protein [Bacillus carboniphilus]|uniref:CotY/CotZ family spore coat protein n=1 Tax=Bacillus carboniphilus TaxID=86663 RepID=A0ABY9JWX7_9BACI|nr:CotY/CotZ family spore coat protein [Bacillus carboniphilus]WLR42125.1 CotY/CotZ family spore coat protein [Bacillus carboniphilus]